jgi:hypothetical protein
LKAQLEGLLSPVELLNLLKGQNLTTLLTSALGTLTSSELVGTLLGNSGEPEQLVGELLAALDAGELEALLGSPLGGASFLPTTVGALAGELGMTSEALAEELGVGPLTLPPVSLALTGALPNGTTLGVLDGLEGLSLGLFTSTHEQPSGEESGEGGSGGAGGSGGSGSGGSGSSGSGSSGTGNPTGSTGSAAGSTTVVVNYPTTSGSALANPARTSGKVKIVSHKVKRGVARIVVMLPAAGRVTLSGGGVRSVHGQLAKAGRITLRMRLTKAARARRGRHGVRVKLTAAFTQTGGPSSAAITTVRFAR